MKNLTSILISGAIFLAFVTGPVLAGTGKPALSKINIATAFDSPTSKVSINPQPESPGAATAKMVLPGTKKAFNPQPEPPAKVFNPAGK